MKTTIINSFEEYVAYTENYKNRYYFRGQSNIEWDITPSLFRNKDLIPSETETIKKEMESSKMNTISSMLKLQHYGCPTRICDLTISPLSALFFSIDGESNDKMDGVVYVLNKTDAISFEGLEINLFSKVLTDNCINIEDLGNEYLSVAKIEEILSQNYIIQYDYMFSYTNQRAILQGGTGIIFGFNCNNGIISPVGRKGVDLLINEKIIIPHEIKNEICEKLRNLGFIHDVMYQVFENSKVSSNFVLKQTKFKLSDRFEFNKIVAEYQISSIYFDRDELVKQINNIYNKLCSRYGLNAHIYLYIYFDENDLVEGNYICRTVWTEDNLYTLRWTKDYYLKRFRYINEQVSEQEVIEKFIESVKAVDPAFDEILQCVLDKSYQLDYLIDIIQFHKVKLNKISYSIDDFPKGNSKIEKFANVASDYIKEVEHLINEIILYSSRGEKEQFLRYWIEVLIKDCKKSKDRLEQHVPDWR